MKEFIKYKDTIYSINEDGFVRTDSTCRISKGTLGQNGYYSCGSYERLYVHRMVAETFIPNPDGKKCVDHINGDRTDNRVENLRWVTYSENMMNPITRKHNSTSQKERFKKQGPWNKGKTNVYSEETKKKMSESKKGNKNRLGSKKYNI